VYTKISIGRAIAGIITIVCTQYANISWPYILWPYFLAGVFGVVPSQNSIRVASMADGGGVGQAPIALDCLRSLLTWDIVT